VLLCVDGWEDMTIRDDACGEMMPPNKEIGPAERQENTRSD
jgi:hypothetical protein